MHTRQALRETALELALAHARWTMSRQITDPASPYCGWLGEPRADDIARAAGWGMPPSRMGWAIAGLTTLGVLQDEPAWIDAGRQAADAALRHWGQPNVLDHESGYILVRGVYRGLLDMSDAMKIFFDRLAAFLMRAALPDASFPHHIGTDSNPMHGDGSKNIPTGIGFGVARYLVALTALYHKLGIAVDPAWETLSDRAIRRALPRQRADGHFPYKLNDDCGDTIHYHLVMLQRLCDLLEWREDYRDLLGQPLLAGAMWLLPPRTDDAGRFNWDNWGFSLARQFACTYPMAMRVLADVGQWDGAPGELMDLAANMAVYCREALFDADAGVIRLQDRLVGTPFLTRVLEVDDATVPIYDNDMLNMQALRNFVETVRVLNKKK